VVTDATVYATEDVPHPGGTLSVSDVDTGDTHTFAVDTDAGSGTGNATTLWWGGELITVTLFDPGTGVTWKGNSVDLDETGFVLNPDGTWTLDTSSALYQSLRQGETGDLVITYNATDNSGADNAISEPKTLTVTVSGTNDRPVVTDATVYATEDVPHLGGTLSVSDVDTGDTHTFAVDTDAGSGTGVTWKGNSVDLDETGFVLNSDGTWTLDTSSALYQSLQQGETGDLVITYKATDNSGADNATSESKTLTITVTGAEEPYDERFVVTRDTASKDFAGVLHNDGLDASITGVLDASITGVLDANGNVVTLAELAAMNDGAGLETRTGRLFMDGETVAFQAKGGVSAEASEVIVYVAVDKDGKEYTQAVQIHFTDDTNEFSSDEAVDTYYVQNDAGDMANLYLGAGSDFVFVEGTQADGITRTVNVGDGDNTVTVKAAEDYGVRGSTLEVLAGAGKDTIEIESGYMLASGGEVTLNAGDGDNTVTLKSANATVFAGSTLDVLAGAGKDTIEIESGNILVSCVI
jgi:VCBS repeat-containing protein